MRADELDELKWLQTQPATAQQLQNTLRVLAYPDETAMPRIVAPNHHNPEEARALLKLLFRSRASLRPNLRAGTLMPQSSAARNRALAPLLETLSEAGGEYPGTNLQLVFGSLYDAPAAAIGQDA